MKNPSLETASIPAQREFMDLMQHGDDFFKIELWRPAKNWYKKALYLIIESERVVQKIAECDKSLIFEVKVIWILASIAAVVVLICVAFC